MLDTDLTRFKQEKKKVAKPIPTDLNELTLAYSQLRSDFDYLKQDLNGYKEAYFQSQKDVRQLHEKVMQSPDIDEIYELIVKYVKVHKLGWKPKKNKTIVQDFMAALEFKHVPIDDTLVD